MVGEVVTYGMYLPARKVSSKTTCMVAHSAQNFMEVVSPAQEIFFKPYPAHWRHLFGMHFCRLSVSRRCVQKPAQADSRSTFELKEYFWGAKCWRRSAPMSVHGVRTIWS